MYLGHSIKHDRNMELVLNLETGNVSIQFHLKFDTHFDTISQLNGINSQWQLKAALTTGKQEQIRKLYRTSRKHDRMTGKTGEDCGAKHPHKKTRLTPKT